MGRAYILPATVIVGSVALNETGYAPKRPLDAGASSPAVEVGSTARGSSR